ncbi:lipid IV(A) palmitoyltransferase PagP [Uliginosibacterium flavum]|uniref:Lipid A palmitoyltransferase PagP n=1 Tax=Uliginosibacterium flavum TaxID=1396831 RepID=A0ABV2TS21_9RHOO
MSLRSVFPILCSAVLGLLSFNASADEPGWVARQWNAASAEVSTISEQGRWDFYEPVYAWHLPFSYNSGQREKYNNTAWPAFGVGKGYYDVKGNRSGLYAMEFIDSNDKWSAMAGYGYSWQYGKREGFNYGLGYTLGLMTREDYFGRFPFPVILPTLAAGYDNVKIEAAYVPGFKKGTGNILFFWLKYELK